MFVVGLNETFKGFGIKENMRKIPDKILIILPIEVVNPPQNLAPTLPKSGSPRKLTLIDKGTCSPAPN